MRTIASLSLLALLCACTGELPAVDARAASDGRPDLDAQHAPDAGAGPDARAAVTTDVVCQPYVRTVAFTDGTRSVSTYSIGMVNNVGPEDDFAVVLCGAVSTTIPPIPPCPAGATCTGAIAPPGDQCYRSYRTGSFVDGKLMVTCGSLSESFAADGTLRSSGGYSYTTVRVITY